MFIILLYTILFYTIMIIEFNGTIYQIGYKVMVAYYFFYG